jgi:hypothetical protein
MHKCRQNMFNRKWFVRFYLQLATRAGKNALDFTFR